MTRPLAFAPPPPRVLMTADAIGGVWSYALALCAALPEIRFVLATMGPRLNDRQRCEVAGLDNVRLEESAFGLEWMEEGAGELAESRRWLADLALRHRAELIHVNGYAHAALGIARPVVVVAHSDVLSWWRAVHKAAAPPEWDRYRRNVLAGLATASRIVAPSAAALADIARQYGVTGGGEVIANGIDLNAFVPLPKRPVVMAAGRIWDAAKNLASLDAIAANLPWPVEIAGDAAHPERGAVPVRSARLLGRLGRADMVRRLGSAAIFAAPARYEPFGLAVLEAAAAGCALVLGDIPSLRENWDGAAVFVDPDDGPGLCSAITSLTADVAARNRLAAAARCRASQFTIARTAQAYRAIYDRLLPAHSPARAAGEPPRRGQPQIPAFAGPALFRS